jgi:hypothetical protein
MRARGAGGFIALEFLLGVVLLLVPTLLLVCALPVWNEREHAAVIAARESARIAAEAWPADVSARAAAEARVIAWNYGIPADELDIAISVSQTRGGQVVSRVTVVMPAIVVPAFLHVGRWRWTTQYAVRIDDYRSR